MLFPATLAHMFYIVCFLTSTLHRWSFEYYVGCLTNENLKNHTSREKGQGTQNKTCRWWSEYSFLLPQASQVKQTFPTKGCFNYNIMSRTKHISSVPTRSTPVLDNFQAKLVWTELSLFYNTWGIVPRALTMVHWRFAVLFFNMISHGNRCSGPNKLMRE